MADPISCVEAFVVPPGWVFVRVETSAGIVGWGEGATQTYAPAVAEAVHLLGKRLVGSNADAVEHLWQLMAKGSFFRGGPILGAAVAAIDIALWDIRSRRRGEPLHQLLGGPVRERVRVYAWCGWGDDDPQHLAEVAAERRRQGFDLVKLTIQPMRALEDERWFDQLRQSASVIAESFGKGGFAVDCHGRCSLPMAKRLLQALEPYRPLFVEEPLLPEFPESLSNLAAATDIPIATGERLYSRWDLKNVVSSGVSILQPDVAMAGGVTEIRRIAALADTWDITIVPHCAVGPIAIAASLQVCLSTSNAPLQERDLTAWEEHVNRYITNPAALVVNDGYVSALRGPGIGIEVDEGAVRDAADAFVFQIRDTLRHSDGSFAEW
jgi:galactonate dehydratase